MPRARHSLLPTNSASIASVLYRTVATPADLCGPSGPTGPRLREASCFCADHVDHVDRSLVSLGFQTESVRTTLRAIADHSVESGPENQSGPHGPQFSAGDCLLSFARIDPHIDPVPIWMIARPLHRQRRDYGTQIPAKSLACFLGVAGVLGP